MSDPPSYVSYREDQLRPERNSIDPSEDDDENAPPPNCAWPKWSLIFVISAFFVYLAS